MLNNFYKFGTVSAVLIELQNFSKYIDHFVIKNSSSNFRLHYFL